MHRPLPRLGLLVPAAPGDGGQVGGVPVIVVQLAVDGIGVPLGQQRLPPPRGLAEALKKRAGLAWACAKKVMPVWSAYAPDDKAPQKLLKAVRDRPFPGLGLLVPAAPGDGRQMGGVPVVVVQFAVDGPWVWYLEQLAPLLGIETFRFPKKAIEVFKEKQFPVKPLPEEVTVESFCDYIGAGDYLYQRLVGVEPPEVLPVAVREVDVGAEFFQVDLQRFENTTPAKGWDGSRRCGTPLT